MNSILTACAAVCGAAIAGSVISVLMPDGSTKKIMTLVMGAFMLCCLIVPVKNAIQGFTLDTSQLQSEEEITASADEAYTDRVIAQAEQTLASTLEGFFKSESIPVKKIRFYLKEEENLGIIINRICIYIDKKDNTHVFRINEITEENFSKTPDIIAEN